MILLSHNKVAARMFRLEIRFINTFANIRQLQHEVTDVQMTLQLLVPSPNVNTPVVSLHSFATKSLGKMIVIQPSYLELLILGRISPGDLSSMKTQK